VLLSAALFGTGHIYQSAKATVVIGVYGPMFGILAEARQICVPESSPTRGMTRSPVWSFVFCRSEATKEFLRKQRSSEERETRRPPAEKKFSWKKKAAGALR
jgi:hypothetical protein